MTEAPKRRVFSHPENNLIAHLYEQGVKPSEIAARLGTSRYTIKNKLMAWGVPAKFRDNGRKLGRSPTSVRHAILGTAR